MTPCLIERLEAAGEGSRELDREVWQVTGGWGGVDAPPSFTTSLDAALALAERVLPGWHATVSTHHCVMCELAGREKLARPNATVSQQTDELGNYNGETSAHMHAATPALALTAAILKAPRDYIDETKMQFILDSVREKAERDGASQ